MAMASTPIIDAGGGSDAGGAYDPLPLAGITEPYQSSIHATSFEAEVASQLGFDYYGFLLYHSGHLRIQDFLARHLTFLDNACGSRFALFTLVAKHRHPLQIDKILEKVRRKDQAVWPKLRQYRKHTEPFAPDLSFRVAEKLGLRGDDLPCLLIFRSRGQNVRSFAKLRLQDSWFPEVGPARKGKSMASEMRWLVKFFDTLQEVTSEHDAREALHQLQRRMDALSRRQKFQKFKGALAPLVKMPFKLIETLPRIVEKVAGDKLTGGEA